LRGFPQEVETPSSKLASPVEKNLLAALLVLLLLAGALNVTATATAMIAINMCFIVLYPLVWR
jgi:hypothetical protein